MILSAELDMVHGTFTSEKSTRGLGSIVMNGCEDEQKDQGTANQVTARDPSVDEIWKAVEACRVCIENSCQLLSAMK